jgi:hypothetical protein
MADKKYVEKMFDFDPPKWYESIYYRICRYFTNSKYWLKCKRWRIFKGYEPHEVWDFYTACATWSLPRLRRFRETLCSHPTHLTIEEWEEILDKIIWSLEQCIDQSERPKPIYPIDYDHGYFMSEEDGFVHYELADEREVDLTPVIRYNERVQEGLDLFGKHFMSLWN